VCKVTRFADVCGDLLVGEGRGWRSVYAARPEAEELERRFDAACAALREFKPVGRAQA